MHKQYNQLIVYVVQNDFFYLIRFCFKFLITNKQYLDIKIFKHKKYPMRKGSTSYSNSQYLQQTGTTLNTGANSSFCIVKNIENCKLTVPTSQTDYKYYQIQIPNGSAIRIYFMTHSIIRVRMCFGYNSRKDQRRQNRQEDIFKQQSYSLVMTAWQDRFDELLKNHRSRIKPLTSVNFQQRETSDGKYYYFQTNQLVGKMYVNPYGLEIYNKSGVLLYKDLKGRAYKRDLQGRIYHYNEIDDKNDCFYGFGQNTGKLNKSGCRMRLAPQDSLGYDAQTTSPLYKHIPFYIKINKKHKHAIGLYYNNSYEAVFDMGSQRSGYWPRYSYYSADGGDIDLFIINGPSIKRVIQRYTDLTGKTAMSPLHSLGYIGSTMYYAELQQKCDQVILEFIEKCIKQNVPISNFHLSSGYTLSQNKATPKRYVFNWNKKKFPDPENFFNKMQGLGVSVTPNIKPGMLTTHHLYEQFASKLAFIKSPQNINLPYTDRWWGGEGSFVDFTDKNSRELWKKYLQQQIISKGTACIWNDNNQYESIDNRTAVCTFDHNQKADYGTVDQLKTVQSLLMAHIAQQAVKQLNPNIRPYIVTRSGCAGIQRYGSSWSGDNYTSWKALQANISTMLNMGLSGVSNYGCDIGGFWGPGPSAQLFVRWVQHGIFQPRFSIHSCNSDNTVTQPWIFPQYSKLISKTIRFRYLLLPYLYSLLYFSHIKGRPIMRPLAYQFQDFDFEACNQQDKVFMFGPYMLIANVIQPITQLNKQTINQSKNKNSHQYMNQTQFIEFPSINNNITNCVQLSQYIRYSNMLSNTSITSRNINSSHISSEVGIKSVYLPKGCNWYTWNGREKYAGGSTIHMKVSLQSIPIFIKDRSIIPLAIKYGKKQKQAGISMLDMNKQKMIGLYIKICFDNECFNSENFGRTRNKNNLEFMLYQDDGVSVLSKNAQKEKEKQYSESLLQSGIFSGGTSQKLGERDRFNLQIPSSASYLITKITVSNPEIKSQSSIQPQFLEQKLLNQKIIIIDINRLGNIQSPQINGVEKMILQIKSIDICPVWITVNSHKCKQVLYDQEWIKWNPISPNIQKLKNENLHNEKQIQIQEYGCWYYDQEKGAAILKLNKYLIRPYQSIIQKYRNLTIKVCKDRMLQFSKQYKNEEQQQDCSEKKKNRKMSMDQDLEEIEERIVGQQGKKIKQRRRIIIKDKDK